jgi:putative phosphoesterase
LRKILLISDTHGHFDDKLLKHIQEADEVWHAGDIGVTDLCERIASLKPLRAVHGNIDDQQTRSRYPAEQYFTLEDVKVLMIHIGGYPGKYPSAVRQLLLEKRPDLFICGHSHILRVIYDKEMSLLHINPGACGIHGFHQVKTAVRFVIDNDQIKDLAIIELGKRTA